MPEQDANQLITILHSLADELGRPPTSRDVADHADVSVMVFRSAFGSWSAALEAAGFDVQRSGQSIEDEDLLDELRRLSDELGHPPTVEELREHGQFSITPYRNHFDSWNAALDTAGLEPRSARKLSREDLIKELQRLGDDLERPPTRTDMKEHGVYSEDPYDRVFDSWSEALDAAGFDAPKRDKQNRIAEEELLDELRRLADELGHPPTVEEMREHGQFSITPYQDRFGSWNVALDTAGLESRSSGKLSREELIEELHRLADELDHQPSLQDMRDHGAYSTSVYYDRFGSWRDALQEAGFEDREPQQALTREELIEELHRLADEYDRRPSKTLMNEEGTHWVSTYENHFSSWSAALEAAGFDAPK